MSDMILNETPVRTSRNFNINNTKIDYEKIKKYLNIKTDFKNVKVINENKTILIDENVESVYNTYSISKELDDNINNYANNKKRIVIDKKSRSPIEFEFKFDNKNTLLINNINIIANENSEATVIFKYISDKDIECFHNKMLNVVANSNSKLNIIIINFLNQNSINLLSIQNEIKENAKVNYTIIDFGGKTSITNYYSNLVEKESKNNIDTIYLGSKEQFFDLNYIAHLRGEKSEVNIEVEGALKDNSKKHFKGTIDFIKGSKKAKGNENDSCVLLSKEAKSISLPMLLCSEEDVEGNHSSSAGKIGDKELFYIMSRGFNKKEAMKLIVRAKFNNILEKLEDESLRKEILDEIDRKLD